MPKEQKVEPSIIEAVQKMVAEGESEQNIIKTLRELGVDEEKAKRLLLVGQADTLALLRNEIKKIVTAYVELEKPKLVQFIEDSAEGAGEKVRQKVSNEVMDDIKQYEKAITGQSQTFEEQINDTVAKMAELSERVRLKLNELGEQVKQVQVDMEEFKLKGISMRNRMLSLGLIGLGFLFILIDLFIFVTQFHFGVTIDAVIISVIVGLLGITMLFVATII